MNCDAARALLEQWPDLQRQAVWGAVARHTWECASCRAELVATVMIAERVHAAFAALPAAPAGLRQWTPLPLGEVAPVVDAAAPDTVRLRLARAGAHLPPLLRLALDPLGVASRWLPVS